MNDSGSFQEDVAFLLDISKNILEERRNCLLRHSITVHVETGNQFYFLVNKQWRGKGNEQSSLRLGISEVEHA